MPSLYIISNNERGMSVPWGGCVFQGDGVPGGWVFQGDGCSRGMGVPGGWVFQGDECSGGCVSRGMGVPDTVSSHFCSYAMGWY